jgi:hypothetical protein
MRFPQPGEQFGRYRIERVIGQGGMGVVYAATDTRLARMVAIKVITGPLAQNPEFLRRFHDEASVLAQLDSPYVISIIDHDEIDGLPYIVTQYVDGTDLGTLLESGPLPAKVALTLCAQVARGLGDAHRRGVVHRDVKPANILLRSPGGREMHAYVIDFGIARSEASDGHTATGMVAGTWAYLAPERTQGGEATPASDLYALGCVLWACLTGRPPYAGSDVEMAIAHAQAEVPQLGGDAPFIRDVNGILARLLAKSPQERYGDAATARDELERLAATAPDHTLEAPIADPSAATVVRSTTPPPPPGAAGAVPPPSAPGTHSTSAPSRSRKWPVVAAVVAVLVIVAGGTAAFKLVGSGDEENGPGDDTDAAAAVEGDVDGDGLGDLLLHQDSFDALAPLSVWTVPSQETRFGEPVREGAEEGNPYLGDVDGDGAPDMVWVDAISVDGQVQLVVDADGERTKTSVLADPTTDFGAFSAVTDLTGDGLDDLVLLSSDYDINDTVWVAESTGEGFEDPELWWQAETAGGFIWTADVDGDGADEVVYWADTEELEAGRLTILEARDGELAVRAERELFNHTLDPFINPWVVGDVDGDGADEFAAISTTGRRITVFEVDGETFTKPVTWMRTHVPLAKARRWAVEGGYPISRHALADVDGDGDGDLIEIWEPTDDGIEPAFPLRVRLSDGSAFGESEEWGELPCGEDCSDSFDPVG